MELSAILKEPRLLIVADLHPVAGDRFQPTGFPDLGAAEYESPGGAPMLLVESAQSMANRLEAVCWDEGNDDLMPTLQGLPYVKAMLKGIGSGEETTCSLLEFHRLNSPYLMAGLTPDKKTFREVLAAELGMTVTKGKEAKPGEEGAEEPDDVAGVFNIRRLAKVVFKYDPNSLIHGVFLEKIAGRLRLVRLLSAFIEAQGAKPVASGGVKFDRVNPKGDTAVGYGNVPFARTEFVAEAITAYFHVDLAQMAAYGLSDEARALLAALALWKIQAFLDSKELRLRTACILETRKGPHVTRPEGLALPGLAELTQEVKRLIVRCQPYFASPAVTHLTWTADEKKGGKKK